MPKKDDSVIAKKEMKRKKFNSFGEFLRAIKIASEGGSVDPRLVELKKEQEPIITQEELKKMEKWADNLFEKK